MSYKSISLKTKAFDLSAGVSAMDVALHVKNHLASTDDSMEIMTKEDGSLLLVVRSNDNIIQKLGGVSSGISVQLSVDEDRRLIVRFSGGKWLNKVLAAGAGIIWWPMAATASIGAAAQVILPISILKCIDSYLAESAVPVPAEIQNT